MAEDTREVSEIVDDVRFDEVGDPFWEDLGEDVRAEMLAKNESIAEVPPGVEPVPYKKIREEYESKKTKKGSTAKSRIDEIPVPPASEFAEPKKLEPVRASLVDMAETSDLDINAALEDAEASPSYEVDDGKLRSLEDLIAAFPVGDGQHYIRVTRKLPKIWQGIACAGIQRPIRAPITYESFVDEYGGGEYVLVMIGPPSKGGRLDPATGLKKPKSLTKDVVFTVPWDASGVGGYPPNPTSSLIGADAEDMKALLSLEADTREEMMDPRTASRFAFHRPASAADAQIAKVQVDASLKREEREEKRARDREAAESAERQREASTIVPIASAIKDMSSEGARLAHEREMAIRQEAQRREDLLRSEAKEREESLRRELENDRSRMRDEMDRIGSNSKTDMSGIAQLISVLRPSEDTKGELARLNESHSREIERLMRAHADDRNAWDSRLQSERDSALRRIHEAEEAAERRIREAEERADRRVNEAKEDGRRQLQDVERLHEMRAKESDKSQDRDRLMLQAAFDAKLAAEKAALVSQISGLEMEIKRLSLEASHYRQEAEANKDIVGQVEKISNIAGALGFVKESDIETPEPEVKEAGPDWKTILGGIATQAVSNMPAILQSAGDAMGRVKGGAVQQQQAINAQQYQQFATIAPPPRGSVAPGAPNQLAFAPEDGGYINPSHYHDAHAALVGNHALNAPPPLPAHMSAPPPPPAQDQRRPRRQQVARPQQTEVQQVSVPPTPPETFAPPAAEAAAPQESEEMLISDDQIISMRPMLEEYIQSGKTPDQAAEEVAAQVGGKMVLKMFARGLSADRIGRLISGMPDGASSVIARRDGQQWLRKLQSVIASW
jgi:hypothetical protein